MSDALDRIAAALERLAPPAPAEADPSIGNSFVWTDGALRAARGNAVQPLARFVGVDAARDALLANTLRLARGLPAHDVLLWGARGMGKSSLVRSVHAEAGVRGHDLALVQATADSLASLPRLFDRLAASPRRFLLFIDDLGFDGAPAAARLLRSLLDGGIEPRPDNARLAVTSNRRHLVDREAVEAEAAAAVHARDLLDDRLALADRFGLALGFHNADQPTYLAMVRGYADALGLGIDPTDALAWASGRGGRSGRVAWQYAQELAGRHGLTL